MATENLKGISITSWRRKTQAAFGGHRCFGRKKMAGEEGQGGGGERQVRGGVMFALTWLVIGGVLTELWDGAECVGTVSIRPLSSSGFPSLLYFLSSPSYLINIASSWFRFPFTIHTSHSCSHSLPFSYLHPLTLSHMFSFFFRLTSTRSFSSALFSFLHYTGPIPAFYLNTRQTGKHWWLFIG